MAHTKKLARLAFTWITALALGAAGCTTQVTTGTDGQGGGGGADTTGSTGGTGGTGGAAPCAHYDGPCQPGDTYTCGFAPEVSTGNCEILSACTTQWGSCYTPLVLSFDGAPVEYLADRAHGFDLGGPQSLVTDWPTARTPWLALDRDGNGRVDDGSELFGSMTVLSSGRRAPDGFAALRELDADGDGRLTPNDPAFSRLLVWSDRDGDRRSTPGELSPAAAWEIVSIDLDDTVSARCDDRGNCEVERAAFRYRDAAGVLRTGAVVDVHLAAQR